MYEFFKQVLAKYVVISDFKTVEKKFLDQGIEKAKVKDYLDRFKKLRDRNKLKEDEKNIDLWGSRSFTEFQERVEDLEKTKTSTEKRKGQVDPRENVPGAIFMTENDEWTVYQITTNEASSKLGQGTEWCIKHESSHYWEEYNRKNNIYFLISKTRDTKDPWFKIAVLKDLHGKVTVWDSLDQSHPSLPDDFKIPPFKMEVFTFKWQADANGDVNASGLGLTSLVGAPEIVTGNFYCSDNKLLSLDGAPREVGGSFKCARNKLTSLKGGPKKVGQHFDCGQNALVSLQGAPEKIDGFFICNENKLKSLVGGPKKVHLYCSWNNLMSLDGAPKIVRKDFLCRGNARNFTEEEVRAACRVGGKVSVDF